ncbi:hypothetical protein, partial [Pseudomonas syringae pv. coryli]|uniref:hypothetical protein n=1 Tax=Pseudomonas syringae pv. coryli TaxID=317659 RepID=UPI001C3F36D0
IAGILEFAVDSVLFVDRCQCNIDAAHDAECRGESRMPPSVLGLVINRGLMNQQLAFLGERHFTGP